MKKTTEKHKEFSATLALDFLEKTPGNKDVGKGRTPVKNIDHIFADYPELKQDIQLVTLATSFYTDMAESLFHAHNNNLEWNEKKEYLIKISERTIPAIKEIIDDISVFKKIIGRCIRFSIDFCHENGVMDQNNVPKEILR